MCRNCGAPLLGGDEAALFLCPICGLAYEPAEGALAAFSPSTASVTTELAVGGTVQYLAFWRLFMDFSREGESAWVRLRRACAPEPVYMYVPAFTLAKAVMQRLGVSVSEAQPRLELKPGTAGDSPTRPALKEVGALPLPGCATVALKGSDFGTLSPVVVGREDCRALAHFVFLAVESYEISDIRSVDYRLEIKGEELIFIPAVWDPRYPHDSNWRLLLREYDGQVA